MGFSPLALALIGGGASAVVGSVLNKSKSPSMPAEPTPPTIMPIADSVEVATARKKSLLAQTQRGGRASTILSGDSNSSTSTTLGG